MGAVYTQERGNEAKGLYCINTRLILKLRPKLGGRSKQRPCSAIYAAKPRGTKVRRCGAQTPSFDLRRKRGEDN